MAVAVRSVSSASANANTVTVTKPSGTADGDYLVASATTRSGTCSAPAGWTLVLETSYDSAVGRCTTFYRIASGEGVSYIFTNNGGASGIAVGITAITGARTTSAPTAAGQGNASSTTCTAPTITPAANSLIMLVTSELSFGYTFSGQTIANSTPTFTEQYELSAPNNGGDGATIACATGVRAAATATGIGTATISSAAVNAGQLISIEPPAAFTMTAAVGAFTLTGVAAALSRIYKIVCAAGAFTLSGVAATLKWFSWIARTRPTSTWTDVNRSDQV